jgi:uncharacterized protein (DUF1697 family)
MKIDHIKLPPVSKKFYDTLIRAYPPMDPLDIKENTSMIEIQRNAAQQEVIQFIEQAVRKEQSTDKPMSIWERFKYVINH